MHACDTPILFAISKEEPYVGKGLVIAYRFTSREVDRFLAFGPKCGLDESTPTATPTLTLFPGLNNVSFFLFCLVFLYPFKRSIRSDLVNMSKAVNHEDYNMDQYTKSGIVGRETTNATAEFGEKILSMVVDNLTPIQEEIPNKEE